jgi:hypothetical protein
LNNNQQIGLVRSSWHAHRVNSTSLNKKIPKSAGTVSTHIIFESQCQGRREEEGGGEKMAQSRNEDKKRERRRQKSTPFQAHFVIAFSHPYITTNNNIIL